MVDMDNDMMENFKIKGKVKINVKNNQAVILGNNNFQMFFKGALKIGLRSS